MKMGDGGIENIVGIKPGRMIKCEVERIKQNLGQSGMFSFFIKESKLRAIKLGNQPPPGKEDEACRRPIIIVDSTKKQVATQSTWLWPVG